MHNKVAILGKLVSKYNAPFEDMSYDIWTCNYNEPLPRVDHIFDIHSHGANPKATINRSNFPFTQCERLVGGQYFNNTFSYMIAFAVLLQYKEIELYGVRLYDDHEIREHQRQNVRELIFFARGRGIKVTAPADECLLEEYEYYGLN